MTNEGLNKLLSIITENKGSKHHISKLSELALNLAENNMVDDDFKEQLFHIIRKKVKSESAPLSTVQIIQTITHYSKCIKKELV